LAMSPKILPDLWTAGPVRSYPLIGSTGDEDSGESPVLAKPS